MYSLLKRSHSPSFPRPFKLSKSRIAGIALCLLTLSILMIGGDHLIWGTRFGYQTFQLTSVTDHACDDGPGSPNTGPPGSPPIPNLVHYVWLLKDPAELRLTFKFFVSIYSVHLFWRPDRIYIHTNATSEVVARARESGTPWTRRILAIPSVELKHVEAPHKTNKGVEIKWIEHQSDFLRLAALREYGGVYLDTDAIPLRDIADLRRSGFRNVVGQQLGLVMWETNYLNNGVLMAVPGSNLITLFHQAAHEFFDGEWDTASIRLLTDLGNRLASLPSEVLILQPQAFSPISWQENDQKHLFQPSMDPSTATTPASELREQTLRADAAASGACRDVLAWMKYREVERGGPRVGKGYVGAGREIDFSSSYVLHAFDAAMEKVLGKGKGVDVRYVLARESNYARAVFPAVWHAVQEGVIPKEELS